MLFSPFPGERLPWGSKPAWTPPGEQSSPLLQGAVQERGKKGKPRVCHFCARREPAQAGIGTASPAARWQHPPPDGALTAGRAAWSPCGAASRGLVGMKCSSARGEVSSSAAR